MSLRIWLPLNGNLNNQGLSNINVVNENATINTSGKIGSCYEFNGSTSRITINYLDAFKGGSNQFTYCCWIYDNDNAGRSIYFGDYGTTGAIGVNIEKNTSNKVRFYWNGSPDKVFNAVIPDQQWIHLTISYDGNVLKCYLNGVLQDSLTQTLSTKNKTSGFYGIGRDNRSDTTAFKGMMNDFRLYDECLTPKQIKEIAKGLVCHYKMDTPYIENTNNLVPGVGINTTYTINNNPAWDTTCNGTIMYNPYGWSTGYNSGISDPTHGYHAHWIFEDNKLIIKFPNLNSEIGQKGRWLGISSGSTVTNTKNILANQKYTISWMQKTDNLELAPYAGIYYKKTTDGTNNFWDGDPIFGYNTKLNTWEKISHTFTRNAEYVENSNSQALYIYGNLSKEGTCYVKDVQIEIGEKVTPYSIGERNLLNITDNSGFNNNATKVGTLTFNSDSPRYEGSTYFNGSALLNNSLGTVLANSKDFTISGWFNRTSGTCYYAGASSSTVPVCLENARFFIYSASGASKVGNWSCTNNVWQYLTLVHNSSAQTLTLYINGIQNQQITTDGTVYNRETLNIGGRNNGGQFVGSMSDFRIYATALSAEEILTLYKNSGIIDNNGNVYTREFKEV